MSRPNRSELKAAEDSKRQRTRGMRRTDCSCSKSGCKWEKSEGQAPNAGGPQVKFPHNHLDTKPPVRAGILLLLRRPLGNPSIGVGQFL